MAWSPNVDLLRQVCELLAHSRSAVGEEHQRALQVGGARLLPRFLPLVPTTLAARARACR